MASGRRPSRSAFARAGGLVSGLVGEAGRRRGFAETRLLTHWREIAGPDLAALCRPVSVGFGRRGLGGTLTLLVRGAAGPLVEARLPSLRERVNACYGYAAISRIRLTQTSAAGFAEPSAPFAHPSREDRSGAGPESAARPVDPAIAERAGRAARDVRDPALRAGLAALAASVMTKDRRRGGADTRTEPTSPGDTR